MIAAAVAADVVEIAGLFVRLGERLNRAGDEVAPRDDGGLRARGDRSVRRRRVGPPERVEQVGVGRERGKVGRIGLGVELETGAVRAELDRDVGDEPGDPIARARAGELADVNADGDVGLTVGRREEADAEIERVFLVAADRSPPLGLKAPAPHDGVGVVLEKFEGGDGLRGFEPERRAVVAKGGVDLEEFASRVGAVIEIDVLRGIDVAAAEAGVEVDLRDERRGARRRCRARWR